MSEQNIEKEQLYKGVFRAEKKDGTVYYRASLTKNGKHISLGSFPDALQAHRAYEQGLLLLSDPSLTHFSKDKGDTFSYERELRDALACSIYSGTNEIQRNTIYRMMNLECSLR